MIPADLAARLRLINEASFFDTEQPVSGLQRAREIQSQLPSLQPGQRFFATLQNTLPDGTFRATVDGKPLTLALNTAAQAGDTLELEVTQLTSRAVFARVLGSESASTASAQPTLSQTGRLISFLLTGQPAPQAASLAGQQPLLNAPPAQGGSALVPLLRQAIGQSGLFYESHQAQWVLGKLDSAALAREPQGQGQPPQTSAANPGTSSATGQAPAASANPAGAQAGSAANAQAGAAERGAAQATTAASEAAAPRAAAIPERLMPIVHQQLDALATNQYLWQGQAWPGQPIELLIEDPYADDDDAESGSGDDAETTWNTTLRLTMPRLGGLEAQLHLTAAGVALRLRADGEHALAALGARRAELANALEAVDLALTGLVLERRDA